MTEDLQRRVDREYVKMLKKKMPAVKRFKKIVVTEEMRNTLAYHLLAIAEAFSDLNRIWTAEIKKCMKGLYERD